LEYLNYGLYPLTDYTFLIGKILSRTFYDFIGDNWQPTYRELIEYNTLINPIMLKGEDYYDQWSSIFCEEYEYDENNLLKYFYYMSYNNGEYEALTRYDYTWEYYASANEDMIVSSAQLEMKVFPSPFSDVLNVEIQSDKNASTKMDIYNLRGQKIYSAESEKKNLQWQGVDTKGNKLPAGIYFVRLSQDGASFVRRVMKLQ